ncbi:hypothetical protein B0H13DRAFT_2281320 [Mycena leptocephala]|nr:hypothetical protein B0H13DRAFT_2281320 [Mycena leptocephala]
MDALEDWMGALEEGNGTLRDELDSWKTRNFAFYAACAAIHCDKPSHSASTIFSPLCPGPRFRPLALDSHSPLAFGLARVFADLTTESRISTPTPNRLATLGQGTLWLVVRKETGRDQAMGKPVAKTERKRSIGKDCLRCSIRNKLYFDASQHIQSQNRPPRTPSRRGGRCTGNTHPMYRCIALWENDYGTGNRRYILRFASHWHQFRTRAPSGSAAAHSASPAPFEFSRGSRSQRRARRSAGCLLGRQYQKLPATALAAWSGVEGRYVREECAAARARAAEQFGNGMRWEGDSIHE